MITKSDISPNGWKLSASKKVDDISRHESKHDPKYDPKHGTKPSPEGGDKHRDILIPSEKPAPDGVKK